MSAAIQHELMRFTGLNTAQLLNDPSQQLAYGYVSGNPLGFVDPLGLYQEPPYTGNHILNGKIDNTIEAVFEYFTGDRSPQELGDQTKREILNSAEVKEYLTRLEQGETPSRPRVDIDKTMETFHVGRSKVFFGEPTCNGSTCSVNIKAPFSTPRGDIDSFDDPLDIGRELPYGKPYGYKVFESSHEYANPNSCK